jgi:macrolide transport system ATP-binding/permease protein
MERALADYPGTLIMVTHDRRLRSSFHGSRLELHRGRARTPLAA